MQGKGTGRFAPFTDGELSVLWDGLTVDGGVRYGFGPEDEDTDALLARELMAEAVSRRLYRTDEDRWGRDVS